MVESEREVYGLVETLHPVSGGENRRKKSDGVSSISVRFNI